MAWLLAELADEYFKQRYPDVISCEASASESKQWRDQEDAALCEVRRRRLIADGWTIGDELDAELKRLKALDYQMRGGLAGTKNKDNGDYVEYRKLFVKVFIHCQENNLTFSDARNASLDAVTSYDVENKLSPRIADRWLKILENVAGISLRRSKGGRPSKK